MAILFICVVIFLIIFLFPFILSRGVKLSDELGNSMIVRNDNVRNPRYFVISFKNMLTKAMESVTAVRGENNVEEIQLSKAEKVIFWDGKKNIGFNVDKICYITEPIALNKNGIIFNKEVYARENVEFSEKTNLRAVAGEKMVMLGEESRVLRWADAEELLVIKKLSSVGANMTSGNRIVVEPRCDFKRMYAPVIEVHTYVRIVDVTPYDTVINRIAPVYMKTERDISEISSEIEYRNSVITKHDLLVRSAAVVYGDLKSDKSIHIRANAVVTGNIFADEMVVLEKGVRVLGNIFVGKDLYIGPDVTIGKIGRTKSAVAVGDVVMADGATIYGYVGAERSGRTIAKEDFEAEVLKGAGIDIRRNKTIEISQRHSFAYIECNFFDDHCIKFDKLEDYEAIDYYAFRDNDKLKSIIIPEGAKKIKQAMFYDCDKLETVYIADSVEEIEDFAFYGCDRLKNVIIGENSRLMYVGRYAFSECRSLESVSFNYMKKIGEAAFRKCLFLKSVEIRNDKYETKFEDGVFQGCIRFEPVGSKSVNDIKKIDGVATDVFGMVVTANAAKEAKKAAGRSGEMSKESETDKSRTMAKETKTGETDDNEDEIILIDVGTEKKI